MRPSQVRIILLSKEEYSRYKKAVGIEPPLALFTRVSGNHHNRWWLRDSAEKQGCIVYVTDKGGVSNRGLVAYTKAVGVRPAVWIDALALG